MRQALGVIVAMLLLAGAAAAARTAAVSITDTTVTPSRVRVDAGGTVTWTNRGAQAHRVASRSGAFAAFTLAAGGSRAVHFARTGRHPYTVDGTRCGVVFVGVALGAGCSAGGSGGGGGGGSGGSPPPSGTKFYRYNVQVDGYIKNDGFVNDSDGRLEQKWTRIYNWRATFQNVRVKVYAAGGVFFAINANAPTFVRGQSRVVEQWDYFWHPHKLFPPDADCDGSETATVPATLAISALSRPVQFFLVHQVPAGWDRTTAIQAACNSWSPPTTQVDDVFAGPDAMRIDADVGTLTAQFNRRGGNALRTPVAALVRGNRFTTTSGLHTSEKTTCEGACSGTLKMEERYTFTFTPRR